MAARNALTTLVVLALGLPFVVLVLSAVGRLLAAMDDAAGARILQAIALGFGIAWLVSLVFLLVLQAVESLSRSDRE